MEVENLIVTTAPCRKFHTQYSNGPGVSRHTCTQMNFYLVINRLCPIQWVLGTLSLGVKRPRREADRSPPSSAEVEE
jgi:hypothetical protein